MTQGVHFIDGLPEHCHRPSAGLELESELEISPTGSKLSDDGSSSNASVNPSTVSTRKLRNRSLIFALLIALIGAVVSTAFISLGIQSASHAQDLRFARQASQLVRAVKTTWSDYELVALWIHEACRSTGDHATEPGSFGMSCSREDFRELYEYVIAGGLKFQAISFVPNVTDNIRPDIEEDSRNYYQEFYPDLMYFGFTGLEPDPNVPGRNAITSRSKQPFYFPQHFIEPTIGNELLVDFDMYSSARNDVLDTAISTWMPVVTGPIVNYQMQTDSNTYLILFHPGVQLPDGNNTQKLAAGLSSVVILFSQFIKRAVAEQTVPISIYIFDITADSFFGGAHVNPVENSTTVLTYAGANIDHITLRSSFKEEGKRSFDMKITIGQQTWLVIVASQDGTYDTDLTYVILGGVLILATCVCLALWFHTNMRREMRIAEIRNGAKSEKAALIVQSAKDAAKAERELNDYLAHEVRNPLAAAITACSFLSSAHQEPMDDDLEAYESVKNDIGVISSSLEFINDLLRSMLDMHKTASNQMKIEMSPADVLMDIFEPVKTILYRRDNSSFEILIDCPKNLVILADRMRLKQVVLNLASNSKKFVQKGFIRLRAEVVDSNVQISVEDSGPGIPKSKHKQLYLRFQESLDSMNQGTGMGLSLCKSLVELMDGDLILDDNFDSGLEGLPGSRFIIDLNNPPHILSSIDLDRIETKSNHASRRLTSMENTIDDTSYIVSSNRTIVALRELPEKLSVLVVDDDLVLRKLLCRAIKRVAPGWLIQEASNGETALSKTDTENFDIIFLDQYMASVEKQLLGTETVYALRAKGVTSRICGLSANDLEEAFLKAGADCFLLKPFQCEKESLTGDLLAILDGEEESID